MSKKKFDYLLGIVVCYFVFSHLVCCLPETYAFDYVMGTANYNKLSIPKPDKGQAITDPNFHTSLTRITDKTIDGYVDSGVTNQYSMVNLKNADGTYLVLRGTGARWYIYNAKTFKMETTLKRGEIGPYWDAKDPNIIYYHDDSYTQFRKNGPKFYKYNIQTGLETVVHDFRKDFPQFDWDKAIGTNGLGFHIFKEDYCEPDVNTRYWPFWIKEWVSSFEKPGEFKVYTRAAFVYDKQEDKVIGTLYPPSIYGGSKGICTVSPFGKYVLVRVDDYNPGIFNITLTQKKPFLITGQGHGDFAIDSQGNEVFVFQDTQNDTYSMFNLETGVRVGLLRACFPQHTFGSYCPGIHVSGNNYKKRGWALCSSYHPNGMWSDDQLFMLELNPDKGIWKILPGSKTKIPISTPPLVWRLAHTHNVGPYYWAQAFATIDFEGQNIYWGSNWDVDNTNMETYVLSLPATWHQDLLNSADTAPPVESTPPAESTPPTVPRGLKILK